MRVDFSRVRQEINHRIEHQLNALVLEGRAAVGREEVQSNCSLADAALDVVDGGLFPLEIGLHQVIILLDRGFNQFFPPLFDQVNHVFGHVLKLEFLRIARVRPDVGFAAEQVNHADKIVFNANRQHHHQRICPQDVFHLTDNAQEVRANTVQFVDEDDAGDL